MLLRMATSLSLLAHTLLFSATCCFPFPGETVLISLKTTFQSQSTPFRSPSSFPSPPSSTSFNSHFYPWQVPLFHTFMLYFSSPAFITIFFFFFFQIVFIFLHLLSPHFLSVLFPPTHSTKLASSLSSSHHCLYNFPYQLNFH